MARVCASDHVQKVVKRVPSIVKDEPECIGPVKYRGSFLGNNSISILQKTQVLLVESACLFIGIFEVFLITIAGIVLASIASDSAARGANLYELIVLPSRNGYA